MSISVITTTYNCALFINEAVKSILNQTYTNFEYLIIDDGSTDDTDGIVNSYNDERIRYYKIDHVGRSKALNYGLSKCRFDWVALIDADDIWHPTKLERQVKLIENNHDVIFSNALFFKKNSLHFSIECPKTKIDLLETLQIHGHMVNSSIIYNKNFIKKFGCYKEELTNSEDYDLLLRIIPKSSYKFIDNYLVFCKLRNSSLSRNSIEKTKQNIRSIQRKNFNTKKKLKNEESSRDYELLFWREYFYGNKKKSRKILLENKNLFLKDYRIALAFIITFLPDSLFEKLLQSRVRLRIQYFFKKFFRDEKVLNAEKVFNAIIKRNV